MALKSNFKQGRFMRDVQKQAEFLHQQIIDAFIMAGEEFVKDAREQGQSHEMGQYKDVTTNLRNSIDYYIFHNGELVSGGKTAQNQTELKAIIQDIIKPKGFQLIGIAGMNYASYVESKGYNVISYQADVCIINLAMYLEKLEVFEKGSAARMEETFIP